MVICNVTVILKCDSVVWIRQGGFQCVMVIGKVNVVDYDNVELAVRVDLFGSCYTPGKVSNEFNNCPTRCDLLSLLHFCRQLCMFQVLTPIIKSSYNCNYSFWY